MSSLDQAFIRAYHAPPTAAAPRQAAPATASATAVADTAAHAAGPNRPDTTDPAVATADRRPLAQSTAAPRGAVPTQVTENRRRHYLDAAHDQTAPPHYFDEPTPTDAAPTAAETGKSAYAHNAIEAEATATDDWRPAYETHRFAWPRNVEVLIAAAGSEFAEFARELQDRVHAGRKTLVVTGVERGEGRTTVLLALARLAANRNLRTAVVDVDLASPQLAEQLGIRPELGWDDVYAERLSATDALIESIDDRLTVLPLRNPPADPRALAGKAGLGPILSELRRRYDLVLLDAGPLTDDPQAIDLAAVLGGTTIDDALVVRDRRRTNPKQVQAVCRRLSALGVRHWDIAENFTEIQGY